MPSVRTRDSGVAPAARGLGTVVPRVSVGGHANMKGLKLAPEVAVAQFTPLKSTVDAVFKRGESNAYSPIVVIELASFAEFN